MDKFGKLAKDKVTGFQGIVTSKHIYIYGCNQYGVSPLVNKDGKYEDPHYFDESRLEIIGDGIKPESVAGDIPGCDFRDHP